MTFIKSTPATALPVDQPRHEIAEQALPTVLIGVASAGVLRHILG
ncbi:hypothetical protein [Ensifer sp. ENS12]|nr:hypothetical protein [Ensifer sp. ENS12]